MNNIRDAIFRFFLKPYCFRRMTIFLLAHPKKTNIIRTRERIIRIFPQTHTHAHTRKKGNVMYILLLLVFLDALLRTGQTLNSRSAAAAQWPLRRRRSVRVFSSFLSFFNQLKKIAKYFFFPFFFSWDKTQTSQQNFSFFPFSCGHRTTHNRGRKVRSLARGCSCWSFRGKI